MPNVRALGLFVLCLLVAALLYSGAGDGALLGFDAYPLIAASRVSAPGDLVAVLGDELMGGRYPDGAFYRPLVHLSFTVNDWLGGGSLSPTPFRWTDVLIAAIAAALVGGVAARLTGRLTGRMSGRMPGRMPAQKAPAAVAAVLAALVFLVHRAQLDVVPYAPRRADALCVLFLAAVALAALSSRRLWPVALLSLAAFLSKETGVIAVPLVAVCAFLRRSEPSPPESEATSRPFWTFIAASTIAVGAGIALRTAILGGLGGHAESGTSAAAEGALSIAWTLWQLLSAGTPGGAGLLLGLTAVIAICLALTNREGRATTAIALTWALAALSITAFSGRAHLWYVVAVLPSVAILTGTAAGAALALRKPAPIAAGGAALVVAGLLMGAASSGPQTKGLAYAGPVAVDQVERFTRLVQGIERGTRVQLHPYVMGVTDGQGAPPIFLHAPYSLQALADLLRPELPIAVLAPGQTASSGALAVIELTLGPPPPGIQPH